MEGNQNFMVSCEIDGSYLVGKVINKFNLENSTYLFTFYKDGIQILRSDWGEDDKLQIEHMGPGLYQVKVDYKSHTKEDFKKSEIIELKDFDYYVNQHPSLFIDGENITSTLSINKDANLKTQCYLLRYGTVNNRTTSWTTLVENIWPVKDLEGGVYVAQWFIKDGPIKVITFSEPLLYMNPELKSSLIQDIKQQSSEYTPPRILNYHYPDQSFILQFKKNNLTNDLVVEEEDYVKTTLLQSESKTCNLYHINSLSTISDNKVFFSGFCNTKDSFIFGMNNLKLINEVIQLKNCLGKYSLICADNNSKRVVLMNDLFGIRHHYVFENENSVFCSNDLHLLIKNLHSNNICLKINWEILSSFFTFNKVQPFAQNFSQNLPIYGLKKLPSGKYLEFDERNFYIKVNEMNTLLQKSQSPDLDYNLILDNAIDELLNNFRLFLKNEAFNTYSLDMSGGLDTRLVASLVSRLHDKEMLKINCYEHPSEPFELNIAAAINNILGIDWDTQNYYNTANDPDSIYSRFFGDYFAHRETSFFNKTPRDKFRVTGFFGEVCARYYYPRSLIRRKSSIQQYFNDISRYAILGSNTSLGYDVTKTIFIEELNEIHLTEIFDKFDLHYCNFRAGSHCDSKWRTYISGPDWSPLQSKNLFILKYSKLYNKQIPSLQYDIIRKLNPSMLEIPFSNIYDNVDFAIYSKQPLKSMKKYSITEPILKQKEKRMISVNDSKTISVEEIEDGWGGMQSKNHDDEIKYNIDNAISYIFENSPSEFIDKVILPVKMYFDFIKGKEINHELKNRLVTACGYIFYTN